MENSEEEYKKRMAEVNKKLKDPKIKKRVDKFIDIMTKDLNCDVEIIFNVYPEVDDYEDHMETEDFQLPSPEIPTMKLGDLIDHINDEDYNFNVYIDPLYLRKGLNELNDILTTTVDRNMIIVPISNKKKN